MRSGDEQGFGGVLRPKKIKVRRSDDTIVEWDREKIYEALRRETSITEDAARIIAKEVEKMVQFLDLREVTAPLIRELTNVKLLEYGLTEIRKQHTRVGLPVYDVKKILLKGSSPKNTAEVLSKRIKREFSLLAVYSQKVGDAHLSGDIHISGIDLPDGVFLISLNLEEIKKGGIRIPSLEITLRPAKRLRTLVDQILVYTEIAKYHVSSRVYWNWFNYMIAPYLRKEKTDEEGMRDLAQHILFEAYTRELPIVIGISADPPPWEGFGPGGVKCGNYGDYSEEAKKFAEIFIQEYHKGDREGGSFEQFIEVVSVGSPCQEISCKAYCFDRRSQLPYSKVESPETRVIYEEIAINLARLAYRSGGSEEIFYEALDSLLEVVVEALDQKRKFLEKINPKYLPEISKWEHEASVSMVGMKEAMAYLLGREEVYSEEALRIIRECGKRISSLGLHINYLPEGEIVERMSHLDLKEYRSDALQVMEGKTYSESFTEGLSLDMSISSFKKIQDVFDLDPYIVFKRKESYEIVKKCYEKKLNGVRFHASSK